MHRMMRLKCTICCVDRICRGWVIRCYLQFFCRFPIFIGHRCLQFFRDIESTSSRPVRFFFTYQRDLKHQSFAFVPIWCFQIATIHWNLSLLVLFVNTGTIRYQEFHHLEMAVFTCFVKNGSAVFVSNRRQCTFFHQKCGCI